MHARFCAAEHAICFGDGAKCAVLSARSRLCHGMPSIRMRSKVGSSPHCEFRESSTTHRKPAAAGGARAFA
eukprot:6190092-Pleurochrysis_carterae.AAC.2